MPHAGVPARRPHGRRALAGSRLAPLEIPACPSVLLPESLETRLTPGWAGRSCFVPLRRRRMPIKGRPVSPEFLRAVVWGPERLRALRLRQRAIPFQAGPLLPPRAFAADYSRPLPSRGAGWVPSRFILSRGQVLAGRRALRLHFVTLRANGCLGGEAHFHLLRGSFDFGPAALRSGRTGKWKTVRPQTPWALRPDQDEEVRNPRPQENPSS